MKGNKTSANGWITERRYYLILVAILLAFAATRWFNLLALPLFVDEAIGINWARDSLIGYPFLGLRDARWLDTAIHALFRPLGPETLWLTRAVTGLLSMLTCASAIGLGRSLDSRWAGLLAGVLYLLLPYAIFFDRQVLGDPTQAAFGAVMLLASVRLARRPRPGLAVLIGVSLAAALLLPVPILSALLLAPRPTRKRASVWATLGTVLAILLVLAVLGVAHFYLPAYKSVFSPEYTFTWGHLPGSPSLPDLLKQWVHTGRVLLEHFGFFFGWPLIVLGAASATFVIAGPRRRSSVWLWLVGFGVFLPFLLITTWLPARYLALIAMPLVVMAAVSTTRFVRLLSRLWQPVRVLGLAIPLMLILWPVPNALKLLACPEQAALPADEYAGYFVVWTSGKGLEKVAAALKVYASEHPGPVHLIYEGVQGMSIGAYWGGQAGTLWGWDNSPDQQVLTAKWLLAGEGVAFLDSGDIPQSPYDTTTETLGIFEGSEGRHYRLRVVATPGPEMLRVMYNQAFGNPLALEADYRELARQIGEGGQALVLYPPHQTEALEHLLEGKALDVEPLGEGWPLDIKAAQAMLRQTADTHRVVTVVFFNETGGDPQRLIETWLNENLFRVSERWVGALRVLDYVSDSPECKQTEAVGVTFGGLMTLDAAGHGYLDLGGSHGRVICVQLVWHAERPIDLSYKIAVHVVNEVGEVIAQHDGEPVGTLAPTHTWQLGETILDRFAISLPAELPLGRYRLHLAVYDGATLQRLPLDDLGGAGDSLVIGELVP